MLATTATAALAPKFGAPTKIASARSTFASGAKPVAALRVTSAGASARLSRKDRAARLVVSANLFNRLGRVIGSYANSLVSAAEDPEKILDQTVIEMQEDLVKMRQASAQVIASQKQLENKYKQAQATADDWYRRAELAMSKGDEELAREALSRKKSYQENADSMKANLAEQEKAVEKLISNTRFLESKMAEAKSKKDTLKARAASAKTNKAVQDLVSGVSTSSALSAFEKMEEKVMGMEAEAEAVMPPGLSRAVSCTSWARNCCSELGGSGRRCIRRIKSLRRYGRMTVTSVGDTSCDRSCCGRMAPEDRGCVCPRVQIGWRFCAVYTMAPCQRIADVIKP